jgi:hypothetical protein
MQPREDSGHAAAIQRILALHRASSIVVPGGTRAADEAALPRGARSRRRTRGARHVGEMSVHRGVLRA